MTKVGIDARLRPFVEESDLGKKASYFTSLRSFEDGFDRAQGLFRTIASGWLLVALAALGTVVVNDAACLADVEAEAWPEGCSYPFGSLARSLILLAAALGITSLWYLDLRVYMSLLHSVFALGVRMEKLDRQLPPVRTVLQELNQDVTGRLSWYYQVPYAAFGALQLVNTAIFYFYLHGLARKRFGADIADWELLLLVSVSLGAVLLQVILYNMSARRWPSLARLSGNIDALLFDAPPAPGPRRPPAAGRVIAPLRQPPVRQR